MKYKDAMNFYPNIPGCMDCVYWCTLASGRQYKGELDTAYNKDKASSMEPCCHYSLKHHVSKDITDMGYGCPYRKERR